VRWEDLSARGALGLRGEALTNLDLLVLLDQAKRTRRNDLNANYFEPCKNRKIKILLLKNGPTGKEADNHKIQNRIFKSKKGNVELDRKK